MAADLLRTSHRRGQQKKHDRSSPYPALDGHKTCAFQHDEIMIIGVASEPVQDLLRDCPIFGGSTVGI
jgi:hypothetical protein